LALLEKSAYDVVLMNMQMVKEGINATLEIRKNPAFDTLSVIAMTTSGIHHDRARCLAAGINGHITQPIDPDELLRALMRWISAETRYAHDGAIIASVSRPLGGSLITMH
jgi:CheY-like chemotaxis protein